MLNNLEFKRNRVPASVWRNPIHFLAFGLGSGASPIAPGTAGTLLAVPLFIFLSQFSIVIYTLVVITLFAVGVYLCEVTTNDIGVYDHSGIVWDEIVGFLIAMYGMPAAWPLVLLGFLLFRLFDIWKPWPIRLLESRIKGGLGIMFDDVLAAIYTWIAMLLCMVILVHYLPF